MANLNNGDIIGIVNVAITFVIGLPSIIIYLKLRKCWQSRYGRVVCIQLNHLTAFQRHLISLDGYQILGCP